MITIPNFLKHIDRLIKIKYVYINLHSWKPVLMNIEKFKQYCRTLCGQSKETNTFFY